jgi:hypothetical protein
VELFESAEEKTGHPCPVKFSQKLQIVDFGEQVLLLAKQSE